MSELDTDDTIILCGSHCLLFRGAVLNPAACSRQDQRHKEQRPVVSDNNRSARITKTDGKAAKHRCGHCSKEAWSPSLPLLWGVTALPLIGASATIRPAVSKLHDTRHEAARLADSTCT
jgi:hypothetical protein